MSSVNVPQSNTGMKLIDFLALQFPSSGSKRAIKRSLESNGCRVNGRIERFASFKVNAGDLIEFSPLETSSENRVEFAFDPERVIYRDAFCLVYDKPPGVAADGENGLAERFCHAGEEVFLVHRLDKLTSGVMLFATTVESKGYFENAFRQRWVEKEYLAIVDGVVEEEKGEIDFPIALKKTMEGQKIYMCTQRGGKSALTRWKVLDRNLEQGCSLVCCSPVTGRTHQLRVHLQGIGHPILGDALYCRSFTCNYRAQRPLLHAHRLAFTLPDGTHKRFEATPAPDFLEVCKSLRVQCEGIRGEG
ncbi:MAG: RluA family pseudouridine synthase [Chlamydiia bacterium]|nr:RluA family pseudouridine synthase [Chlamydiia bacterium]